MLLLAHPLRYSPMQRGVFIVVEGPDRCGKTFHAKALIQKLQGDGYNVLHTAEPTDGPIGKEIRRCLAPGHTLSPERLQILFSADRALHLAETVEPALQEGKIVVCDRYIPSTLAFGEAAGVDPSWLYELNKNFIQPDYTIYLLPPCLTAIQHFDERPTDRHEVAAYQVDVHKVYTRLIARSHTPHAIFDTSAPKENVMQQIFSAVQEILQQKIALV